MNSYSIHMPGEFETCVTFESLLITSIDIGNVGLGELHFNLFLRLTRSEEGW